MINYEIRKVSEQSKQHFKHWNHDTSNMFTIIHPATGDSGDRVWKQHPMEAGSFLITSLIGVYWKKKTRQCTVNVSQQTQEKFSFSSVLTGRVTHMIKEDGEHVHVHRRLWLRSIFWCDNISHQLFHSSYRNIPVYVLIGMLWIIQEPSLPVR